MNPSFFRRQGRRRQGTALIITLFFLMMITILAVGFVTSMRTERLASHSNWTNEQTKLVADSAVAHAVSLLANKIPAPSAPGSLPAPGTAKTWTVNPGRLTVVGPGTATETVDLHTGAASSASDLESADLNARDATGDYAISPGGEPMRVKWRPVLTDHTKPADATNPIAGRYAFWIDDESARINFNTAAGKPADIAAKLNIDPANPWASLSPRITKAVGFGSSPETTFVTMEHVLGHPASVNLDVLETPSSKVQKKLYGDIYTKGFLTAPDAIRNEAYVTGAAEFYRRNKFFLTAFSRSPEFNAFGKSRLFVTGGGLVPLSRAPMYQFPLDDSQPVTFWDAQTMSSAGGDEVDTTNRALVKPLWSSLSEYLRRDDWPGMPSESFATKWGSDGAAEADQVALNLVGMGALASAYTGSPNQAVSPQSLVKRFAEMNNVDLAEDHLYPGAQPPDLYLWKGPATGQPMLPQLTGPRLNELAVCVTPEPIFATKSGVTTLTGYYLRYSFRAELYMHPDAMTFDAYDTDPSKNRQAYFVRTAFFSYSATTPGIVTDNVSSNAISQTFNLSSGWEGAPLNAMAWTPGATFPFVSDSYNVVSTNEMYMGVFINNGAEWPVSNLASRMKYRSIFPPDSTVRVRAWLRMGTATGSVDENTKFRGRPIDLVPIFSPDAPSDHPAFRAKENGGAIAFDFTITLDKFGSSTTTVQQVQEVADPRVNALAESWQVVSEDSFGAVNSRADASPGYDESKNRTWDVRGPSDSKLDNYSQRLSNYPPRWSAPGMFSLVSTGMRRNAPWKTFALQPASPSTAPGATPSQLPDWLLLDLLAPAFVRNRASVDGRQEATPISAMNSTAGKINLNSKIYPVSPYFAPASRVVPLQALFRHMPDGDDLAQAVVNYQEQGGRFDYIGQICEVPGVSDTGPTEYDREAIVRHLAGCMTTQSNTFGIHGVAQSVRKAPGNTNHGEFEEKDIVLGEKRFYAVVERYVWPGRDGVPGNGHATSGAYDELATGMTAPQDAPAFGNSPPHQFAAVDGPDAPKFANSYAVPRTAARPGLDQSDNPLRALMKYRIIYFKYLTD
jgi:hypothetical protein